MPRTSKAPTTPTPEPSSAPDPYVEAITRWNALLGNVSASEEEFVSALGLIRTHGGPRMDPLELLAYLSGLTDTISAIRTAQDPQLSTGELAKFKASLQAEMKIRGGDVRGGGHTARGGGYSSRKS